eukprot:5838285-Pleurochrysis_carterae.AAC.1
MAEPPMSPNEEAEEVAVFLEGVSVEIPQNRAATIATMAVPECGADAAAETAADDAIQDTPYAATGDTSTCAAARAAVTVTDHVPQRAAVFEAGAAVFEAEPLSNGASALSAALSAVAHANGGGHDAPSPVSVQSPRSPSHAGQAVASGGRKRRRNDWNKVYPEGALVIDLED